MVASAKLSWLGGGEGGAAGLAQCRLLSTLRPAPSLSFLMYFLPVLFALALLPLRLFTSASLFSAVLPLILLLFRLITRTYAFFSALRFYDCLNCTATCSVAMLIL